MLLDVENILRIRKRAWGRKWFWISALFFPVVVGAAALSFPSQTTQTASSAGISKPAPSQAPPTATSQGSPQATPPSQPPAAPRAGLNIVVLDPAHGGTDTGARGTAGIRESEIVLDFAAQVRRALEAQGFQVVQTRQGNEDPSFDDRSAIANAQSGAVFVTLHIAST